MYPGKKSLLAVSLVSLLVSPASWADTFKVGVVPQFDIKTLHTIWEPILTVLEEKTGHQFVLEGSPDIPTFEKEFAEGKFDFAYMNPYHYTTAQHYKPIIRDHGRQLYGILAVKADSEITTPQQLEGKTLVFPAPNALGASLMIRAELREKYGVSFNAKYVKTHSSVFLNVVLGMAQAGGGVQKTFNRQPDQVKDKLRILAKTDKVQPHPLTAKVSLDEAVVKQVQGALIEMGNNAEQKALLAKVPFKKIGPATDGDYDGIRKLNLARYYVAPE